MPVDSKKLVLGALESLSRGDKDTLRRILNRWTDETTDVLKLWAVLAFCHRKYPLPQSQYTPFSEKELLITGLSEGFPALVMLTLRALNNASPTLIAKVIFDTIDR